MAPATPVQAIDSAARHRPSSTSTPVPAQNRGTAADSPLALAVSLNVASEPVESLAISSTAARRSPTRTAKLPVALGWDRKNVSLRTDPQAAAGSASTRSIAGAHTALSRDASDGGARSSLPVLSSGRAPSPAPPSWGVRFTPAGAAAGLSISISGHGIAPTAPSQTLLSIAPVAAESAGSCASTIGIIASPATSSTSGGASQLQRTPMGITATISTPTPAAAVAARVGTAPAGGDVTARGVDLVACVATPLRSLPSVSMALEGWPSPALELSPPGAASATASLATSAAVPPATHPVSSLITVPAAAALRGSPSPASGNSSTASVARQRQSQRLNATKPAVDESHVSAAVATLRPQQRPGASRRVVRVVDDDDDDDAIVICGGSSSGLHSRTISSSDIVAPPSDAEHFDDVLMAANTTTLSNDGTFHGSATPSCLTKAAPAADASSSFELLLHVAPTSHSAHWGSAAPPTAPPATYAAVPPPSPSSDSPMLLASSSSASAWGQCDVTMLVEGDDDDDEEGDVRDAGAVVAVGVPTAERLLPSPPPPLGNTAAAAATAAAGPTSVSATARASSSTATADGAATSISYSLPFQSQLPPPPHQQYAQEQHPCISSAVEPLPTSSRPPLTATDTTPRSRVKVYGGSRSPGPSPWSLATSDAGLFGRMALEDDAADEEQLPPRRALSTDAASASARRTPASTRKRRRSPSPADAAATMAPPLSTPPTSAPAAAVYQPMHPVFDDGDDSPAVVMPVRRSSRRRSGVGVSTAANTTITSSSASGHPRALLPATSPEAAMVDVNAAPALEPSYAIPLPASTAGARRRSIRWQLPTPLPNLPSPARTTAAAATASSAAEFTGSAASPIARRGSPGALPPPAAASARRGHPTGLTPMRLALMRSTPDASAAASGGRSRRRSGGGADSGRIGGLRRDSGGNDDDGDAIGGGGGGFGSCDDGASAWVCPPTPLSASSWAKGAAAARSHSPPPLPQHVLRSGALRASSPPAPSRFLSGASPLRRSPAASHRNAMGINVAALVAEQRERHACEGDDDEEEEAGTSGAASIPVLDDDGDDFEGWGVGEEDLNFNLDEALSGAHGEHEQQPHRVQQSDDGGGEDTGAGLALWAATEASDHVGAGDATPPCTTLAAAAAAPTLQQPRDASTAAATASTPASARRGAALRLCLPSSLCEDADSAAAAMRLVDCCVVVEDAPPSCMSMGDGCDGVDTTDAGGRTFRSASVGSIPPGLLHSQSAIAVDALSRRLRRIQARFVAAVRGEAAASSSARDGDQERGAVAATLAMAVALLSRHGTVTGSTFALALSVLSAGWPGVCDPSVSTGASASASAAAPPAPLPLSSPVSCICRLLLLVATAEATVHAPLKEANMRNVAANDAANKCVRAAAAAAAAAMPPSSLSPSRRGGRRAIAGAASEADDGHALLAVPLPVKAFALHRAASCSSPQGATTPTCFSPITAAAAAAVQCLPVKQQFGALALSARGWGGHAAAPQPLITLESPAADDDEDGDMRMWQGGSSSNINDGDDINEDDNDAASLNDEVVASLADDASYGFPLTESGVDRALLSAAFAPLVDAGAAAAASSGAPSSRRQRALAGCMRTASPRSPQESSRSSSSSSSEGGFAGSCASPATPQRGGVGRGGPRLTQAATASSATAAGRSGDAGGSLAAACGGNAGPSPAAPARIRAKKSVRFCAYDFSACDPAPNAPVEAFEPCRLPAAQPASAAATTFGVAAPSPPSWMLPDPAPADGTEPGRLAFALADVAEAATALVREASAAAGEAAVARGDTARSRRASATAILASITDVLATLRACPRAKWWDAAVDAAAAAASAAAFDHEDVELQHQQQSQFWQISQSESLSEFSWLGGGGASMSQTSQTTTTLPPPLPSGAQNVAFSAATATALQQAGPAVCARLSWGDLRAAATVHGRQLVRLGPAMEKAAAAAAAATVAAADTAAMPCVSPYAAMLLTAPPPPQRQLSPASLPYAERLSHCLSATLRWHLRRAFNPHVYDVDDSDGQQQQHSSAGGAAASAGAVEDVSHHAHRHHPQQQQQPTIRRAPAAPGGGIGRGGGGVHGGFVAMVAGTGSYKYNSDDLGAVVHTALQRLHGCRAAAQALLHAGGTSSSSVAVDRAPLSLRQRVDCASIPDVSDAASFGAAHRFLRCLLGLDAVVTAIAADGDVWRWLRTFARMVGAYGCPASDAYFAPLADLQALHAALEAEAADADALLDAAQSTLDRHLRVLEGERKRRDRERGSLGGGAGGLLLLHWADTAAAAAASTSAGSAAAAAMSADFSLRRRSMPPRTDPSVASSYTTAAATTELAGGAAATSATSPVAVLHHPAAAVVQPGGDDGQGHAHGPTSSSSSLPPSSSSNSLSQEDAPLETVTDHMSRPKKKRRVVSRLTDADVRGAGAGTTHSSSALSVGAAPAGAASAPHSSTAHAITAAAGSFELSSLDLHCSLLVRGCSGSAPPGSTASAAPTAVGASLPPSTPRLGLMFDSPPIAIATSPEPSAVPGVAWMRSATNTILQLSTCLVTPPDADKPAASAAVTVAAAALTSAPQSSPPFGGAVPSWGPDPAIASAPPASTAAATGVPLSSAADAARLAHVAAVIEYEGLLLRESRLIYPFLRTYRCSIDAKTVYDDGTGPAASGGGGSAPPSSSLQQQLSSAAFPGAPAPAPSSSSDAGARLFVPVMSWKRATLTASPSSAGGTATAAIPSSTAGSTPGGARRVPRINGAASSSVPSVGPAAAAAAAASPAHVAAQTVARKSLALPAGSAPSSSAGAATAADVSLSGGGSGPSGSGTATSKPAARRLSGGGLESVAAAAGGSAPSFQRRSSLIKLDLLAGMDLKEGGGGGPSRPASSSSSLFQF